VPNHWVLKTDADSYTFDQLVRDGRTVWDGVSNAVALKNIRSMVQGDQVLIYHSGEEKALVGLARVASAPYPDPKNPQLTVVDIAAGPPLPQKVTLAEIKADPAFAELALVRQPRLSVGSVPPGLWNRLLGMAGVQQRA
jgi:predicted RNA-binding protein with PUA-like domain